MKGSLARVSSYVKEQREKYENVILMDNGDILQGQPVAYYYNYMDTISEHVCAAMLNYMKYDVGTMGNHDVEPDMPCTTDGCVSATFRCWEPISSITRPESRICHLIRL